eukprot:363015-Chlamydomonas_euryale.AAC.1
MLIRQIEQARFGAGLATGLGTGIGAGLETGLCTGLGTGLGTEPGAGLGIGPGNGLGLDIDLRKVSQSNMSPPYRQRRDEVKIGRSTASTS